MVKFGGEQVHYIKFSLPAKTRFKKHPLQNRTNVQTKGGGVKGLLNNIKKKCTFLSGWLPLDCYDCQSTCSANNSNCLGQASKLFLGLWGGGSSIQEKFQERTFSKHSLGSPSNTILRIFPVKGVPPLTIDQKDEETCHDHEEDKEKDKNKDIVSDLVAQ